MTAEDILGMATYIAFPDNGGFPSTYDSLGLDIIHLPIVNGSQYAGYGFNGHHFTTKYHREHVYPMFADILGFEYNPDEFDLIEYKDEGSGRFDLSYLRPKVRDELTIYRYISSDKCFECSHTSDELAALGLHPELFPDGPRVHTNYHKLYMFAHQTSRIVNHSCKNGRKLVLSGDSQLIPDVPFLSHFFEEVWMLDNRSGRGSYEFTVPLSDWWKDVEFTDALVEFWGPKTENATKFNLK